MRSSAKKVMRNIIAGLLLFCLGFCSGYLFNRVRSAVYKAGAAADVRGYDEAEKRIERAASAVSDAAASVSEASGEVRISVNDVGIIREISGDIERGNVVSLDGLGDLEDGVRRVIGIIDEAEKRNEKMENDRDIRMD